MLVHALEDIWVITPDPRRDRLMAGFVTQLVSLATGIPAAEINTARRTTNAAVRARHLAIYQDVTHIVALKMSGFDLAKLASSSNKSCRKCLRWQPFARLGKRQFGTKYQGAGDDLIE